MKVDKHRLKTLTLAFKKIHVMNVIVLQMLFVFIAARFHLTFLFFVKSNALAIKKQIVRQKTNYVAYMYYIKKDFVFAKLTNFCPIYFWVHTKWPLK